MDAFVTRVEPDHALHPARTGQRSQARRQRERGQDPEEPQAFELEPGAQTSHAEHHVPRSPHEDGLGDRLDVTA